MVLSILIEVFKYFFWYSIIFLNTLILNTFYLHPLLSESDIDSQKLNTIIMFKKNMLSKIVVYKL